MTSAAIACGSANVEAALTREFLETRCEACFTDLYRLLRPQLVAFFRARGCLLAAEDLAQEVMFTVYRKAGQVRDRSLFRAWMFRIARNALSRHFGDRAREVDTVDLADIPDRLMTTNGHRGGTPAFEFYNWIAFLDSREREALTLRFIEQWEYHEIAAAQDIPIGTVQWRVFNAKKKLAPLLKSTDRTARRAA